MTETDFSLRKKRKIQFKKKKKKKKKERKKNYEKKEATLLFVVAEDGVHKLGSRVAGS